MNFVIPMAGKGSRFTQAGHIIPKMLIPAKGKTLLEWSVDSLPLELASRLIFIGLKEHEDEYNLKKFILSKYSGIKADLNFLFLEKTTRGQAETVLKAEHLLNNSADLVIFNIDTCFYSKTLKSSLLNNEIDGVLGAFFSNESRFSFARLNEKGIIDLVAEKEPISNLALTGLYHFKRPLDFLSAAKKAIQKNETVKSEFYIAPLYNKLIKKGGRFMVDMVQEHHILGTPEELNIFLNSNV